MHFFVVDVDGSILHASCEESASQWGSAVGRPLLAEAVATTRAYSATPPSPEKAVRVSAVPLHGGKSPRYLVVIDPLSAHTEAWARLTEAQARVAQLLLTGATLTEIASALNVSAETIKSHTRAIYTRLGVSTRVELAAVLGTSFT
jgi:DNA-binding CsgD family transcriptional regulator